MQTIIRHILTAEGSENHDSSFARHCQSIDPRIASNNSGVWNETGAALEFSIAPAYYQTRWFEALMIFGTAARLWLAYAARNASNCLRQQSTYSNS